MFLHKHIKHLKNAKHVLYILPLAPHLVEAACHRETLLLYRTVSFLSQKNTPEAAMPFQDSVQFDVEAAAVQSWELGKHGHP